MVAANVSDANGLFDSGSVYVYELGMMGWGQSQKLVASNAAVLDKFGQSVSLSGNRALIGAIQADANGVDSGTSYFFESDTNGVWSESELIVPSDNQAIDNFGFSTAIDGILFMSSSIKDDDNGTSSGSVYTYKVVLPDLIFNDSFE
jgi:hypothetical protein